MPKASQAENKRNSDSIIKTHRHSEHQTIRETTRQISALQKADRQQGSRNQRKAIQKIEELLRPYKRTYRKIPKKFCRKLRSMRFLLLSLPISIYVDSSPLVLYPRSRLRPPPVSETRLCFRTRCRIRTQYTDLRHSVLQTTGHYSTHLPLPAYAACGCRAY